jgi:hypothetical protein
MIKDNMNRSDINNGYVGIQVLLKYLITFPPNLLPIILSLPVHSINQGKQTDMITQYMYNKTYLHKIKARRQEH